MLFLLKKTVTKATSDGRARHRNRSGVVELVGREPLIIARVENGVKKLSPQSDRKRQNFQKKMDHTLTFNLIENSLEFQC